MFRKQVISKQSSLGPSVHQLFYGYYVCRTVYNTFSVQLGGIDSRMSSDFYICVTAEPWLLIGDLKGMFRAERRLSNGEIGPQRLGLCRTASL